MELDFCLWYFGHETRSSNAIQYDQVKKKVWVRMTKCIISICNNEGTKKITDAKNYPEQFNGKLLCDQCFQVREYMKDDNSEWYVMVGEETND